jgi:hypothetical protein
MPIDVSASSLLLHALSVHTEAPQYGIKVPSHISRAWRSKLSTPEYRDALVAIGADPTKVGALLGNSHRWDQGLCKFFTLKMFEFFMKRTAKSKFQAADMLTQYSIPNSQPHINLLTYTGSKYASRFVMEGPAVFIGNTRYITIKIKTEYPNVSKGPDEYNFRWINMRYKKNLATGAVELQPIPEFKPRRTGSGYTTVGEIKNMEGMVANFSYCALANSLKELCILALRMVAGENIPPATVIQGQSIPFDLINLLQKRNNQFRIVTYNFSDPLFTEVSGVDSGIKRSYRVNGDEGIYFVYGTNRDISHFAERGLVEHAFDADLFHLGSHNLYAQIDSEEPVCGVLFECGHAPDTIGVDGFAVWNRPAEITSYEILDEPMIIESFGV